VSTDSGPLHSVWSCAVFGPAQDQTLRRTKHCEVAPNRWTPCEEVILVTESPRSEKEEIEKEEVLV
jgi:hypothetical protein